MNTENICKALYALPGGVVTPKPESIARQVIVAGLGIALLIFNYTLVDDSAETLSMALLTLGIGMILYGVVVGVVRHSSHRNVPYDNQAKCFMRYRERYYDRGFIEPIRRALESGDVEAIEIMPTTNIASVVLVEYSSNKRRAYALYEYGDQEYRPIGNPRIINKS
jgi:hypothetical protein